MVNVVMELSLAVILLLLLHVSETNPTNPSVEDVKEVNGTIQDLSDVAKLDCEDRWSCRGYDYAVLSGSLRGHYIDRNCACDELCLLLQDCCPDAHLAFSSVSGDSSDFNDMGSSEDNVPGQRNAPVVDRADSLEGSRRLESSVLRISGLRSSVNNPNNNELESPWLQKMNVVYSRYSLDKDMFTCLYDSSIDEANNVSVVTRCPEEYDHVEVTKLCHNVMDDDMMTRLPVSGKESGVLYRNMFCAMCHEEPYLYWAAGVDCSSDQELPYDINSTRLRDLLEARDGEGDAECPVRFHPPSRLYRWRPCVGGVRDQCQDSFPRDTPPHRHIVDSCEDVTDSTRRMVFGETMKFRNEFCAVCNNKTFPEVFCKPLSWGAVTDKVTAPEERKPPYSFSILLDINTNTGSATVGHMQDYQTVERNESFSCDQGQVFDPFKSVCRHVTCGPGRHFVDNTCRKKEEIQDETSTGMSNGSETLNTTDSWETADCSFIQLNATEYRIFQNGTLELLGTDNFYNTSQYTIIDEEVHLCVSYTRNHTRVIKVDVKNLTYTFSLTEAVISTCGICISLVALAVTMFVYLSLRALRNIPGQNLLSLVCSLFLADLLLLLAPSAAEEFLACAVIAGIMHYFFLASFMWMNVMAVDVWFTFSKAFFKAGDRGKSSKRFIMYSAYSWLTPLVFVLSAALVQILKPSSAVSPQYGEGICWLSNKYGLLLFFAAPLLVLLVLNIVLFVISARNIFRAKRTTARMLGKEGEEGEMGIYVKLTVVMGITWILGFLAALVPGNLVLTYCFVIMNTLQGLFICLSFVCTRKVLSLLKNRFCGGRRKFKVTKTPSTNLTNVSKSLSGKRKSSSASSRSHSVVV